MFFFEIQVVRSAPSFLFYNYSNSSTATSSRPLRAAVANAVAISEAASGSGDKDREKDGGGDKTLGKRRGRKPGMGFNLKKNLDLKKKRKRGLLGKLGAKGNFSGDKGTSGQGQRKNAPCCLQNIYSLYFRLIFPPIFFRYQQMDFPDS